MIRSTYLVIRIKIIYLCLVEGKGREVISHTKDNFS
jgi:hypothetical protein